MIEPILAAGGLVVRPGSNGAEVLLVHRPRYDDWSLPKGKLDPGENSMRAALREVEEEAAIKARIIKPLDTVSYSTAGGNHKIVDYFAMRADIDLGFQPNHEVDEIRWSGVEEALSILTYDFDRQLVAANRAERLLASGFVHLIRHANAGDRSDWKGPDDQRPLTKKGWRQAEALAEALADTGVGRIFSSPYMRCRQTVEPLSALLGIEIEQVEVLSEGAGARPVELMESLIGNNLVMCSHGDVIPATLDRLGQGGAAIHSRSGTFECKKASMWTATVDAGSFTEAHYTPPPG